MTHWQEAIHIVGIDEVGRGPVAGPVLVAGVCVHTSKKDDVEDLLGDIRDSKKLSESKREEWFTTLKQLRADEMLDWKTSLVHAKEIDAGGIVAALRVNVERVLEGLGCDPKKTLVLLDGGLFAPKEYTHQETIIKGDDIETLISAASVIAKVSRDWRMKQYGEDFPEYGFEQHKGYGTKKHLAAIKKHGMCPLHRRSFLSGL